MLSQPWQNIFDVVDNRSNVADPVTASTEKRKFVYEREPNTKAAGFAGYPCVIVHPAELTMGKKSADAKKAWIDWSVEVEIVTSDRGGPGQQGQGAAQMNAISDDVMQSFTDRTILNTLKANNIELVKPDVTDVSIDDLEETLVFRRSFLLSFRTRMTVSNT